MRDELAHEHDARPSERFELFSPPVVQPWRAFAPCFAYGYLQGAVGLSALQLSVILLELLNSLTSAPALTPAPANAA